LLISQEDCRNFDDMSVVMRYKKDTVPANTFPVPPLPLAASQRDDITPKRIMLHLTQTLADKRLLIRRKPSKLSFGVA
jgi:hypothetical protein